MHDNFVGDCTLYARDPKDFRQSTCRLINYLFSDHGVICYNPSSQVALGGCGNRCSLTRNLIFASSTTNINLCRKIEFDSGQIRHSENMAAVFFYCYCNFILELTLCSCFYIYIFSQDLRFFLPERNCLFTIITNVNKYFLLINPTFLLSVENEKVSIVVVGRRAIALVRIKSSLELSPMGIWLVHSQIVNLVYTNLR